MKFNLEKGIPKAKEEDPHQEEILIADEEILSIIEILKPDDVPLDKYQKEISKELFESVKKIQMARGSALESPEKTVEEIKKILNTRLKAIIEDSRKINQTKKLDESLVRRAKIALLYEGDLTDAKRFLYSEGEDKEPDLDKLRNYIVGENKEENKLTEREVDWLMKTKYKKVLTNPLSYYTESVWNLVKKEYIETIPESVMINILEGGNLKINKSIDLIDDTLGDAKNEKYSHDLLEKLLAINESKLCLRNFEKFKGKPIEKIILSYNKYLHFSVLEVLNKLNLSQEEFEKYCDIAVKHNLGYQIMSLTEIIEEKNLKKGPIYLKVIEKFEKIATDGFYQNQEQHLSEIKNLIKEGFVGLGLGQYNCKEYIEEYARKDYEDFKEKISKHKQENLVFEYLKEEDKIKFAHELIERGEEYNLMILSELFNAETLGVEIYIALKKKNFIPLFFGNLSRFKDLPQEEALQLIEDGKTDVFLKNITSFKFTEGYLKTQKIQDATLLKFSEALMEVNAETAKEISEKIPFPKDKKREAVLKALRKKWIDQGRNDLARVLIHKFPEVKKYLDNPEDRQRALNDLKKETEDGNLWAVARILECFHFNKEALETEEIQNNILKIIRKSISILADSVLKGYGDTKTQMDRYFENIKILSKYIQIPEYLLKQRAVIDLIYLNKDEKFKLVQSHFIKKILQSEKPNEDYENLLKLFNEVKDSEQFASTKEVFVIYLDKFEKGGTDEEKAKFISINEMILKKIPIDVYAGRLNYLYHKFYSLSEDESVSLIFLLKRLKHQINYFLLKDVEFEDVLERLLAYSQEEQNQTFKLTTMKLSNEPYIIEENNYAQNAILYIIQAENLYMLNEGEDKKKEIFELFKGEYKDFVLKNTTKEWQAFLNSEDKYLPPNIYFISKIIKEAGGAGNLKHLEALSGLIYRLGKITEEENVIKRTKEEIKKMLFEQENKFDKEKISQDERSEFYNLSSDILIASPSLYSAFYPIFETLSLKDMKFFIKEMFPLYQAQLIIIQEMQEYEVVKYNPKDLVLVRESLRELKEKIQKSEGDIKKIFNSEKTRLTEVVKRGFKDRFGLMKVPDEFSKENIRSIQNGIRYIGNIAQRDKKKEVTIAFFIGLEINNHWSDFREGKEINLEEYFKEPQLSIIKPIIEERDKNFNSFSEYMKFSREEMQKFQEILQEETISSMVGNMETIDIKLGNIKRNILELTDPDIYENPGERETINLLIEKGKLVGSVLAKTYTESIGKEIKMNEEEKALQSKIASIFGVSSWDPKIVKNIQDTIQPLNLVANMVNKIEEEKVDENINELQARLIPSNRIIEIFNRLGEEFKQESGAMALSNDITYLENLLVKDEKKISPEEKEEIGLYLDSIKDKMKDLEITLEKVKEYFNKLKKSSHLENNQLLKNRLTDIEKIIHSKDSSTMIISHMTKDLNLIIENMRQCLGCLRKEINNDTNLAFGEYNKFFIINQGEKEKGSISDEIVFLFPIKTPNGQEEMSFILDRVYGSKSSDILIGNISAVYKKYQALQKLNPSMRLSISIPREVMSSVGIDSLVLKNKLKEKLKDIKNIEEFDGIQMTIPKSGFSDNYIEFGSSIARKTGESNFNGLILR